LTTWFFATYSNFQDFKSQIQIVSAVQNTRSRDLPERTKMVKPTTVQANLAITVNSEALVHHHFIIYITYKVKQPDASEDPPLLNRPKLEEHRPVPRSF
jgi:hypothetical protein